MIETRESRQAQVQNSFLSYFSGVKGHWHAIFGPTRSEGRSLPIPGRKKSFRFETLALNGRVLNT